MINKLRNRQQGFTIIEVLIVLAIAGLIMVVVFLAVPALQRNQRNQAYRTEANNLLGAYQEISNNKGGAPLTPTVTSATDSDAVLAAAGTSQITAVRIVSATTGPVVATGTPGNNIVSYSNVMIRLAQKCVAQDSGAYSAGAPRQVALFFAVEVNNVPTVQCISS